MTRKDLVDKLKDVPDDTRVVAFGEEAYHDQLAVGKGVIRKGECAECFVCCPVPSPDSCDWLCICDEDCDVDMESVIVIKI